MVEVGYKGKSFKIGPLAWRLIDKVFSAQGRIVTYEELSRTVYCDRTPPADGWHPGLHKILQNLRNKAPEISDDIIMSHGEGLRARMPWEDDVVPAETDHV